MKGLHISSVLSEQYKNAWRKPLFNGEVSSLFREKPLRKRVLSPLKRYSGSAAIPVILIIYLKLRTEVTPC